MDVKQLATNFSHLAFLMELNGESPFKTRAYHQLVELLEGTQLGSSDFVAECKAGNIKGVGVQLTKDLQSLLESGHLPILDELQKKYPRGLLELAKIPGLGTKKIRQLYDELEIATVQALLDACQGNKLAGLKGFGEKSQTKFMEGAKEYFSFRGKCLLPWAERLFQDLQELLRSEAGFERLECVGELRRTQPIIDAISVLVVGSPFEGSLKRIRESSLFASVEKKSELFYTATTEEGVIVSITFCVKADAAWQQILLTGSTQHVEALLQVAQTNTIAPRDTSLSRQGETWSPTEEAEIYRECGLAYVPAECREGSDEIELAKQCMEEKRDFPRLVTRADIQGILHAHSHYSDGKNSLREMAEATKRMGFQYFGISDHSQSAGYANGLKLEAIRRQHQEIDELNAELAPFHIFKGIEADILDDGRLDYEDETLSLFDFIIVSIHSRFTMSEAEMTKRMIRALENPFTTILAHPTGRLLLKRRPYAVNIEAVLEAASTFRVAVEINSNPRRLDLDWSHLALAKSLGIHIPICPDAHSIPNLENISYGISMARKGRLGPEQILNCRSKMEIEKYFSEKKPR